jgi:hypothetical protein
MAYQTPYGVPPPVTVLSAVKTPAEVSEAIVVEPCLNNSLPPDSSIVKLVVPSLTAEAAVVAFVAVAALPVVF